MFSHKTFHAFVGTLAPTLNSNKNKMEKTQIAETKSKLEAFLSLHNSGISNDYVKGNIIYHATRYHDLTGDWYRRQGNKSRKENK